MPRIRVNPSRPRIGITEPGGKRAGCPFPRRAFQISPLTRTRPTAESSNPETTSANSCTSQAAVRRSPGPRVTRVGVMTSKDSASSTSPRPMPASR
ncbi:MAG: hypothetical protein AMJ59_14775 [Gammaproteobacteria bacterium SG8_31]|nr:MAG: hypothetical protein AMJ59_14775 [Gammaproteobacteria bacterium SG8_31]